MSTHGELRSRLSKTPIGNNIDLEVLTGHINDRIETICRLQPWTRMFKQTILQTVAQYITGTVSIVSGATAGTGAGTTFTAGMTGRLIRISNAADFYTFTFVGAGAFTIDRPYEAQDDAVNAPFRIWQPYYELPSDLAEIRSLRNIADGIKMEEWPRARLDEAAPSRETTAATGFAPLIYVPASDSPTPLARIELFPGPFDARGLPMDYKTSPPRLVGTSDVIPDWIHVKALYEGVLADLYSDADRSKDAQLHEQLFMVQVKIMQQEDARRMPPARWHTDDRYTNHRRARTAWAWGPWSAKNWGQN